MGKRQSIIGEFMTDKEPKTDFKYWECPHCRFRVADVEYLSIIYDPICRCKRFSWSGFRSVIPKESLETSNAEESHRRTSILPSEIHNLGKIFDKIIHNNR